MSPTALMVSLIFILTGCGQSGDGARKQYNMVQSKILWKRSDLYEGQAIRVTSPNQLLELSYNSEKVSVSSLNRGTIDLDVTPPASVLWRPNGRGVAINNGNGSGQMSELIIIGDGPSMISGVETKLKSYFFAHTGCRQDPSAVSVSAEGWSADSSALWVRFESWDRRAVCHGESVSFAQFDIDRGQVMAHLSLPQAMDNFCEDSKFRELYRPNCIRYE